MFRVIPAWWWASSLGGAGRSNLLLPFWDVFFPKQLRSKIIGIYLIKTEEWKLFFWTKCLVGGFWSFMAIWKWSDLPMSQNKGLSKTLYKWPEETNGYGGPEKMRHIFLETLETQVLDRSSLLIWWYLLAWLFYPVVIPSNKTGTKVMKYANAFSPLKAAFNSPWLSAIGNVGWSSKYTTWKLDGASPMYWFIIAPYSATFWRLRHLLSRWYISKWCCFLVSLLKNWLKKGKRWKKHGRMIVDVKSRSYPISVDVSERSRALKKNACTDHLSMQAKKIYLEKFKSKNVDESFTFLS